MVVKDEAQLIGRAIRSVRELVDEIVVVDTGSMDATPAIARRLGARVIRYAWDGSLGRARNRYISHSVSDWILVLDGDESIAAKDLPKLRKLLRSSGAMAYRLPVRNYSRGLDLYWEWHPNDGRYPREERLSRCHGWSRTSPIRLFRRTDGIRYTEGLSGHAHILESIPKPAVSLREAEVTIHHFDHLKGPDSYILDKESARLAAEIEHSKLFPRDPHIHLNIAKTLFHAGSDERALLHLRKALRIDPGFYEAFLVRGMLHLERGNLFRASRDLRQATSLRPDHADARAILGRLLATAGDTAAAKRELDHALRLRPCHPLALNSLGIVHLSDGDVKAARSSLRRAIEVLPDHPQAHFNLALLYRQTGDWRAAKAHLRHALRIHPGDRDALKLMRELVKNRLRAPK